jgi:signal transduction histidine kinase/DNA-binding response OmpR family regulator/ligand-binding sensor domain-containing protein
LLNENIEVLFKDSASNIWIGTKTGGLSVLDTKNNHVENYNNLFQSSAESNLRITALSEDKDGNLWVGTWGNGVFVFDIKKNKLLRHYDSSRQVHRIIKDFKNNMWFCSGGNLHVFNPTDNNIRTFKVKGQITDLLADAKRNKIWFSSSVRNTKLFAFNYDTDAIESLETGVLSDFSKKLSLDEYSRIWIGTWGRGVYRSNQSLTNFVKIDLVANNPEKINANYSTILNIHHDANNVVWLATANGGVVKLLEGNGFENAHKLIQNEDLKNNFNFTSIYRDSENIYLGTLFTGLYYGKDFSNLKQIEAIGNQKVNTLYAHNEKLYIGVSDGFYIYDLRLEKIIFFSNKIIKVTAFLIENDTIYIGSQQQGIAIVNLEQISNPKAYQFYSKYKKGKKKIKNNRITSILKDEDGNIWMSTYNGLHLFDKEKKEFIHETSLLQEKSISEIINAFATKGNFIWLATPNGLIKLTYKEGKLNKEYSITKKDGLNSDFICSITFDDSYNMWLTTHTEIVKYNDTNKSIFSYGYINGVRSTSFNSRSFYNYNDEFIYFGGIDNITFFDPSTIKDFKTSPEIIFTSLRVNNQIVDYNYNNKILDKSFNYAEEIKLRYRDNYFSTRFVANDFLGALNIKYRYLIEGYQDQWVDLGNRNEINFAGLSPGKYILKVEASRNNQNWSNPKSIAILLSGSPWKSPAAIITYLLILSAIAYYFIKSNNVKLRLKNSLEIARIDKEKEIELAEAKLNFFTNISHEFRTPLTLIISPLKELMEIESLSPKIYKNLNYIDKNTSRLLNLINQLLDFRKADHGLLKLNVSQGNFVRFAKEVHLYFKEAAKAKNVTYKFKSTKEEILFPFDRNKMEIVLCNILSNALKYTNPDDKIVMKIDSDSKHCIISIKDSGIGMKLSDQHKIFDRFFQIKTAKTARMIGSGIGLSFSKKIIELHYGSITVNSQINVGTEFTIKLSLNPKVYGNEIDEDFINSDNIKGYNTEEITRPIENLNIKAKQHSVLIIDDNLEILSYLKDILSDTYSVIQANNGDVGFEKASSDIPDLIISDVMMPGKDGITLCKELKSQITTSHIPIILLTARTSTVFEIEGLKTGADDYITKPFNSKVIKARISSLLENREKLRAHLVNKVRFEPTVGESEIGDDAENAFIHKAILLVEDNLDNSDFKVEHMVNNLNMSQSTLYRKIKSLTGLSLTAFIRSVRLRKAAHLILSSNLSLNEIAFEVGFNDYKYFNTSFKKQFKCLPSQYKEKKSNTSS